MAGNWVVSRDTVVDELAGVLTAELVCWLA